MAKQREETAVASLNPRDMLAGGLKDDFRGRIIDATFTRWDYDGNIDEPVLAAKLVIDELDADTGESLGEDPVVQHWSAGNLDAFVPSQDGRTPSDDDEDGPCAVKVGKKAQLNNNTNWAHLVTTIVDSGNAAKGKPFTEKNLTASMECFVGLDAHWNRVPQKKRSGLVDTEAADGQTKRGRDVLVVTEVYGFGDAPAAKAGKGKPNGKAGKPSSVKAKVEEEDEDEREAEEEVSPLDEKLNAVVLEAITDAGGKLKKGKLPQLVLKALAADKDKSKGVRRVSEDDFLQGGPWTYDEDTGVLEVEDE